LNADLDPFDFDAAVLRRSETDLRAFMSALAVRLEGALPGRVAVTRRRLGLFSKESEVAKIVFSGDGARYDVECDRGRLKALKAKQVRGVVLSSSELPMAQWLADLRGEVGRLASEAGASADVLHDFL
jgi:hypothetical protein